MQPDILDTLGLGFSGLYDHFGMPRHEINMYLAGQQNQTHAGLANDRRQWQLRYQESLANVSTQELVNRIAVGLSNTPTERPPVESRHLCTIKRRWWTRLAWWWRARKWKQKYGRLPI